MTGREHLEEVRKGGKIVLRVILINVIPVECTRGQFYQNIGWISQTFFFTGLPTPRWAVEWRKNNLLLVFFAFFPILPVSSHPGAHKAFLGGQITHTELSPFLDRLARGVPVPVFL